MLDHIVCMFLQKAARGRRIPKSAVHELEALGLITTAGTGSKVITTGITAKGERILRGVDHG